MEQYLADDIAAGRIIPLAQLQQQQQQLQQQQPQTQEQVSPDHSHQLQQQQHHLLMPDHPDQHAELKDSLAELFLQEDSDHPMSDADHQLQHEHLQVSIP